MTEIKGLLDILVQDTLTPEETDYINSIKNGTFGNQTDIDILFQKKFYLLDRQFRMDALKKVLSRKYENYMNYLLENEDVAELLPTLQKIKEQEDKTDECVKSKYLFITLSPKSIGVYDFIKYIDRVVKFSWVKQYVYVLEQRYDGTDGKKNWRWITCSYIIR